MKENILYAYHIEVENLEEHEDYSVFTIGDDSFYFTKLKRSLVEWNELLLVLQELEKKQIPILPILRNTSNSFITRIGEVPYVLIKADHKTTEYGILEIMSFQKLLVLNNRKSALYRNTWAKLWSEKVDYLEYQVHEMGKNYPIILNSFSYFVGLAENAICYVKFVEKHYPIPKDLPIVLSHRRVYYPNIRLNFDNPLNFIFDIEERDIASYIKSMFFIDPDGAWFDLKTYVNLRKPDIYSLGMLYARLLYPSYYFDLHEKIMEKNESEENLLPIIDKADAYQDFLKKVWFFFREYAPLEPIPWIIEKEL